MALIEYTSYEDVRAALGVSVDELEDATLALDLYEFNLVSELEEIDLSLISDFAAQMATGPTTWTTEETRFFQAVRLFSTYAVAKQATTSLPMFSPKEQSDGKATLVRFAQDPYKATIASVIKQYEAFKVKLEAAYSAIHPATAVTATSRPYFSAVSASFDPITGA